MGVAIQRRKALRYPILLTVNKSHNGLEDHSGSFESVQKSRLSYAAARPEPPTRLAACRTNRAGRKKTNGWQEKAVGWQE